jgi:hypothetical protein
VYLTPTTKEFAKVPRTGNRWTSCSLLLSEENVSKYRNNNFKMDLMVVLVEQEMLPMGLLEDLLEVGE